MTIRLVRGTQEIAFSSKEGKTCFYDTVPALAESTLDSLYESLMCSLDRLKRHYPLESARAYLAYDDNSISSLFIFQIIGKRIVVHNEQISISNEELIRFVESAFKQYPSVAQISFHAIDTDLSKLPFVHHAEECLEDLWLELPRTRADYMSSLGKKTSETFKRAEKKLQRDHPSFQMKFLSKQDISEEHIAALVNFSRLRMEQKGIRSYHTEDSTTELFALTKKYGLLGLALIDGKICGGIIQLRIGSHWFSHTISHDPTYDAYRLGQLCNLYGLVATIEHGGGVFHFGWGRSEHKYRMGAKQTDLFKLDVYRSALSFARDAQGVTVRVLASGRRKFKFWVAAHENGGNVHIAQIIKRLKEIKAMPTVLYSRLRS
jgi:hypothetical protein